MASTQLAMAVSAVARSVRTAKQGPTRRAFSRRNRSGPDEGNEHNEITRQAETVWPSLSVSMSIMCMWGGAGYHLM
jgi:hypothetical protein